MCFSGLQPITGLCKTEIKTQMGMQAGEKSFNNINVAHMGHEI